MTTAPARPFIDVSCRIAGGGWLPVLWADEDAAAAQMARWVAAAVQTAAGVDAAVEASVLLTDDAEIQQLNAQFRGRDVPTDVLSWPAADWPGGRFDATVLDGGAFPLFIGDIALGFETTAADAARDGKAFDAHAAHLIVHGTLHLLGYDHREEAAADQMETAEVKALAALGVADPYKLDFGAPPAAGWR